MTLLMSGEGIWHTRLMNEPFFIDDWSAIVKIEIDSINSGFSINRGITKVSSDSYERRYSRMTKNVGI